MHRVTSSEFSELIAFYLLEPLGESRADLHAGIVAAAVVNSRQGRKKGSKSVSPTDFLPEFVDPKAKGTGAQSPEEQIEAMAEMVRRMGGQDLR